MDKEALIEATWRCLYALNFAIGRAENIGQDTTEFVAIRNSLWSLLRDLDPSTRD